MGRQAAIASGLILAATPTWFYCGLYGHPITIAMLLFFTGLAILCRYDRLPPLGTRLGVVGLFAAALALRFDTVLLFVAVAAVLWACRTAAPVGLGKEGLLYVLGSLTLFAIAQKSLPLVSRGPKPASILTLAKTFQIPSHLMSSVRESVIVLGQGFTAVLLVTIPVSAWILFRKRNYPALLFVSGTIAINLVFWLPNSSPPRHYLMMAPAMSASAALVALAAIAWLRVRQVLWSAWTAWSAGLVMAIAIFGVSELLHHYGTGHLSYFRSPFEKPAEVKAQAEKARRIAAELMFLPPLSTPVIVLCDANLVIAEMVKYPQALTVTGMYVYLDSQAIPIRVLQRGSNQFIMPEQGWDEAAIRNFDQSGTYPGLPVLVTTHLSDTKYDGYRRRLADSDVEGLGTYKYH
jgi:hypothetical protein